MTIYQHTDTVTAGLSAAVRALGDAAHAEPDVTRRLRYTRHCAEVIHLLADALERRQALERERALEKHRALLPRRLRMLQAAAQRCPNFLDTLTPKELVVLYNMTSETPLWLSH